MPARGSVGRARHRQSPSNSESTAQRLGDGRSVVRQALRIQVQDGPRDVLIVRDGELLRVQLAQLRHSRLAAHGMTQHLPLEQVPIVHRAVAELALRHVQTRRVGRQDDRRGQPPTVGELVPWVASLVVLRVLMSAVVAPVFRNVRTGGAHRVRRTLGGPLSAATPPCRAAAVRGLPGRTGRAHLRRRTGSSGRIWHADPGRLAQVADDDARAVGDQVQVRCVRQRQYRRPNSELDQPVDNTDHLRHVATLPDQLDHGSAQESVWHQRTLREYTGRGQQSPGGQDCDVNPRGVAVPLRHDHRDHLHVILQDHAVHPIEDRL